MATPPIIAFSLGLLRKFTQEDHFAGVLLHELTHKELSDRYPDHKNSKLEEGGADVKPVFDLQRAGYRPRAMAEMLKMLPETSSLASYFDVHPGGKIRVRVAENAADALVKLYGTENTEPTSLNATLWEKIRSFNQLRPMQQLLVGRGFNEADVVGKFRIATDILDNEPLNPSDPYAYRRVSDLVTAVRAIPVNNAKPEELAALDRFASYLVRRHEKSWEYTATVDKLFEATAQMHALLNEQKLPDPDPDKWVRSGRAPPSPLGITARRCWPVAIRNAEFY